MAKTPKNADGTRNHGTCKCGQPATKAAPCPYDAEMACGEADAKIEWCKCCGDCRARCAEEV